MSPTCGKLRAVQLHRIRIPGAAAASEAPPGEGPTVAGHALVDQQAREVRYLRVSLTDRCNLRCTYCMPEEGIDHVARADLLSLEEIVAVVRAFVRWGVERVRLTGGEPTLRRNLPWLVEQLSALELAPERRRPGHERLAVAMTSNAERLVDLAEPLRRAGLAHLNLSLDTLDAERFAQIARRDRLGPVLAGIDASAAAGFARLKINTVAIRGFNDDELGALCEYAWARGAVPRFIELMPMSAGRLFVPGELLPAADIRALISEQLSTRLEPVEMEVGEGERGYGPARLWRALDRPGQPVVGVISAMTENFCDSCNRLRISATGQLHACLARDDAGDLRAALRSDMAGETSGALEDVVRRVLGAKRDRHDFAVDGGGGPQKAMISIGG